MNFVKKHSFLICSVVSLLLGAIVFISFYGWKVINPSYMDWLFESHIDMKLYYTGWHYFRFSDWNFPLGLFDSISYPNQISVLNTDSIPLLAIIFKIFRRFLPADFQYLGLYSLISYMLQSLFGFILIKKFTKNDIQGYIAAIISGLFFVLMPSFIIRTLNTSIFANHWIILAAFVPVIYKFRLKTNIIYYAITGFLAASVNPYITIISAIILLFGCLYNYTNEKNYKEFLPIGSFILTALIVLYIIGAFSGMSHISSDYLDENSFNLNGFISSCGYLRFFDDFLTYSFRQVEGYAYFGIGILILISITIIHFVMGYIKNDKKFEYKKELIFIAILILISVILALSPTVTYSNMVLFEIPYPDFIINIWSIFRTTGRFIWIANYLILILALGYIVKHFSKKTLFIILICCLGLQIFDFLPTEKNKSGFVCSYRNNLKTKTYSKASHTDETWNKMFDKNNIKHIFFDKRIYETMFGEISASNIVDLSLNIRNKGAKFNAFYFARPVKGLNKAYSHELENPKDEDIFIFVNDEFDKRLLTSPEIKYFYKYKNFYIARTIGIKGWEDLEIKKEDIKQK